MLHLFFFAIYTCCTIPSTLCKPLASVSAKSLMGITAAYNSDLFTSVDEPGTFYNENKISCICFGFYIKMVCSNTFIETSIDVWSLVKIIP